MRDDLRPDRNRPRGRMERWLVAASLLVAASVPCSAFASAAQSGLAVDVPRLPGGAPVLPNQIVRATGGGYVVEATLPPGFAVAAMARTPSGKWLLTPAVPAEWAGILVQQRDIVSWDPGTGAVTLFFDGGAAGLPA